MHATIPALPTGFHHLTHSGILNGERSGQLDGLFDRAAGRLVAGGMARLIELGFGFLVCEGLTDQQTEKARRFFEDNFVLRDLPDGGVRYYQGKFLIRTRKPEDDMNVHVCFCPDVNKLFNNGELNPSGIVETEVLSEEDAERMENDPDQVDLIIRFSDVKAILNLIEEPDVDVVQLLFKNQVQLTGNFAHMFKFGAIGESVQAALGDWG